MTKSFWFILTVAFLLSGISATAQKRVNTGLYNHAAAAPDSVEDNFAELTAYLKIPATNQSEIVEAIFYWIAINITYYNDPDFELDYPENIAMTTLLTKQSGCEGTARLFYELCAADSIECAVIFGFAEGNNFDSRRATRPNHGWNAVNLDGKWMLVDATWGSGGSTNVGDKREYVKELDFRYFFADPGKFAIDHLPQNASWQLLDPPVSKKQFYSDEYEMLRMAWHTRYGD